MCLPTVSASDQPKSRSASPAHRVTMKSASHSTTPRGEFTVEAEALLALAQRLGQFVAFQLAALALIDVAGVGAHAGGRRVDALLAPAARGGGHELDDAWLAQLHGAPVEPPHDVIVQVRIDVPEDFAEQIGGRAVGEPSPGFVHVDEAILPSKAMKPSSISSSTASRLDSR